jgi:hypothetical protein
MSNDLSRRHPIILDTVGLVWRGKGYVRAMELIPANAGDTITLLQYKTATPIANSSLQFTGTITSNSTLKDDAYASENIITSSAFPQFSLLNIRKTGGSADNRGLHLITTAGDNDQVVCSDAKWPLTNEASKLYEVEAFVGTTFYKILSPGTDKQSVGRYFDTPLEFENLALSVITNGATLLLYID